VRMVKSRTTEWFTRLVSALADFDLYCGTATKSVTGQCDAQVGDTGAER